MKIRNGFVSNSSSSSFLIYGALFEDINEDTVENIEETVEKSNSFLEVERVPEEFDRIFVGLSWDKVRDDETGLEFKNKIENELNRLFPNEPNMKISTWHEAWRD